MRIILYLGKGGVGKTTVAAATALRSAQLGYRTLVVSTDIAHSLADSLDRPLQSEPVEVAPNLFAQEINVLDEVRNHWGKLQAYMGNMLRKQGMSKAIAEEMAIIPGMEEIVSLLHIYRNASAGDFDRVVVDAAPTGETMRLLTMPESFQWYVDRFYSWGDTAMRFTGGLLRKVIPDRDVMAGLPKLIDDVKMLQGILSNPDISSYRIVLNPEKMVVKEGARAMTYLSLFNYPVDAAIVNRVLPGIVSHGVGEVEVVEPSADAYLRQLQSIQARYLGEIERDFYPLPIFRSRWSGEEMVGMERLAGLAVDLFGDADPGQVFFRGQAQAIEEEGSDYVLKLPLPHVELEKVKLTKRGDELFITIGNFKREILLPSVLAQRDAAGAVFRQGVLHVRFPERAA
ncbi:ArsA family ATPase [bacterium]|nr:ArsA family ATPase [bacterium]